MVTSSRGRSHAVVFDKPMMPDDPRKRSNATFTRHVDSKDIIKEILKNNISFQIFRVFAAKEFSAENLDCYAMIEYFENHPSIELAQKIYITYLAKNSPKLINTSKIHTDKVKNQLDKLMSYRVTNYVVLANVFDEIKRDLGINISDTWSRFQFDDSCRQVMIILGFQHAFSKEEFDNAKALYPSGKKW